MIDREQIDPDLLATWAHSAPANTNVVLTITDFKLPLKEHEIIVFNPSTATDLTVKIMAVEPSLGGASRNALLTTLSIPRSQTLTGTPIDTHRRRVENLLLTGTARLVLSNDTALGVTGGFTAVVRVRQI
ncbi:MAG: hypothetical protein DDT19_00255 [Syntrophomonadaceae bacterium]|nr:hypothetical protein [Bacillota bacterium]